MENINMN
jgi:hypothetical protein